MTTQYAGAKDAAAYLGTSISTIHNWCRKNPEGFPAPTVEITSGRKVTARGWTSEQLDHMRAWYAQHNKMTEEQAADFWKMVDARQGSPRRNVHPGQLTLEDVA